MARPDARSLGVGEALPVVETPQSQFRVRFTRARGLAALFERPENTYHWSGYGTLRVEPQGVQFIATRRRLLGLPLSETRFVAGREISNVYREADAVRVEFRDEARQNYLHFWAEDSTAAASIVEQLPTARTVELEDERKSIAGPPEHALHMRAIAVVVALAVLGTATWLGVRWFAHREELHRAAAVETSAGPRVRGVEKGQTASDAAVRASISADERASLQKDFTPFLERSRALAAQFRSAFKALEDGSLSQEDFANGLERWLLPQWASEEKALRKASFADGSRREALRASLISITSNWRNGLEAYVEGLRARDPRIVQRAFAYIGAAEESEREARRLLEPDTP